MPLSRRLGDSLASPRARVLVPLAGVLLTLPSLTNGLVLDDLMHRMKARGLFGTDLWSRLNLFAFVPDDAAIKARFYETGFLPWFAPHDLKLAFLRPVSAALHLFDYTVLDRWPWAMHAESLAIYAGAIALAAALYRRLLPLGVAMLAALLFAIDDAHALPVGWLANRNAVLATGFGLATIVAHDRWRRDAWKPGAWLAPAAFVTALLSAELGLGSLAYLVAHAVTLDRAPWKKRAWALAPYVAIVIAWQIVYRKLGYGAFASGLYVDPIADTGGFLRAVPAHAAVLLLGQLSWPPSDAIGFVRGGAQTVLVVAAMAFTAFVAWVVTPMLRRDASARFFALGMLLAVAPVVASFPSDRLLFFVGVGAFGLVAQIIGDLRGPAPEELPPRAMSARVLRRFWMGIHLVFSPLFLPLSCMFPGLLSRWVERTAESIPNVPEMAQQTVVLTSIPTMILGQPWLFPRDPARVVPKRVRAFASTTGHVAVTREDARTVLIALAPDATPDPMVALFRDPAHPVHVGDEFESPGLHVTIVRMDDNDSPVSVRYRFDRDLDDPSFRWVGWNGKAFYDTKAPAVGARVVFGGP